MPFREINSSIRMSDAELKRFNNAIKESEKKILKHTSKNNKFNFQKIGKKKKIFVMRGSFEKYLITKLTEDCDVAIYIKVNDSEFSKIKENEKEIRKFKSQFQTFIEEIFGNQIKKSSSTKPSVDLNLYENKTLSLIPVLTDNKEFMTFYVTADHAELKPTRKWNVQSWFNKYLSKPNFGKNKRKNIRVTVKVIKVLLHPSFQNLSATPLEGYILEKYFPKKEKNNNLDYLKITKKILETISNGELDEYVETHKIFSTWGWKDKNKDATESIKNRAENIYNTIKDMNLEQFKKYLNKNIIEQIENRQQVTNDKKINKNNSINDSLYPENKKNYQ